MDLCTSTTSDDPTPFPRRYDPAHPRGRCRLRLESNVNALIEMTDMREAERSYEANLNVIRATKAMLQDTIEVLR